MSFKAPGWVNSLEEEGLSPTSKVCHREISKIGGKRGLKASQEFRKMVLLLPLIDRIENDQLPDHHRHRVRS